MGGCANSKYAVDEDKKEKKPIEKKDKKKDKKGKEADVKIEVTSPDNNTTAVENQAGDVPKAEKEDIEFIDKEEAEKAAAAAAAAAAASAEQSAGKDSKTVENDDAKKEVTTYQTTVVKHTQKEGDELLQHLRDEAFRTLQNLLKQQSAAASTAASQTTTKTTTTASASNSQPQTTSSDSSAPENEDIVQQIKAQVLVSLGKTKQDLIYSIIDAGAALIKENKVKNMNDLQSSLEKQFPEEAESNGELVKKVINATTGFLTAKGTEAGALLSNILANVSHGIQGVMNETEKTTVKVTRTVTEQVLSGGQLKEITRVITSNEKVGATSSNSSNIEDIIKNLSQGESLINKVSGTTTTVVDSVSNEKHETVQNDEETKKKAEEVVHDAVEKAVEKLMDEEATATAATAPAANDEHSSHNGVNGVDAELQNGHHEQLTHENIKIEEESTVNVSTTKIILNGNSDKSDLEQVQTEFYKNGKQAAEDLVKKISNNESELNNSSETTTIPSS